MNRSPLVSLWLAIGLALLIGAGRASATSVGVDMTRCPLCGQDFGTLALLSYSTFSASDKGPEPFCHTCPHCLYTWTGALPAKKLNAEEGRRVRAAIASWPASLPPDEWQRMRGVLRKYYGYPDESRRFQPDLAARCEAARQGKALPASRLPRKPPPESIDRKERREQKEDFLKQLPALLSAQRRGERAVLPEKKRAGSFVWPNDTAENQANREQADTVYAAIDAIEQGDARAVEYFLHWATSASLSDLRHRQSYPFIRGLVALGRPPILSWPTEVDLGQARCQFAGDCLRYIHENDRLLPETMRHQLRRKKWNNQAKIVLAACAMRRDREIVEILMERLASKDTYLGDEVASYYEVAGTAADLPALAAYVQSQIRLMPGDLSQMTGYAVVNYEDAIRAIQFQRLLNGGSAKEDYQAK